MNQLIQSIFSPSLPSFTKLPFHIMYQQCMYIITEIEKIIHSSAHMNSSVICFCFACPIMKIRYMPVFFLYSVIIIYYLLLENDCNFSLTNQPRYTILSIRYVK